MSAITMTTAALPTGVRVPWVERGDPEGIPILLLHGWTDSWRSFEPMLDRMPAHLRSIAATQRGHGDADKPEAGYSPAEFAADAVALLDHLTIGRAVVVGHSMGAWVAERIALDHPERVLGLMLAGAVGPANANATLAELFEAVESLADPVDPAFVHEFQIGTTARPLPPGQLDAFVAESLKVPASVWRATAGAFPGTGLHADLAGIEVPTLLVWGDEDAVTPRPEQEELVRVIPGARLTTYTGTGHAVHWEHPQRFATDVASFAEAVRAPRTTKPAPKRGS